MSLPDDEKQDAYDRALGYDPSDASDVPPEEAGPGLTPSGPATSFFALMDRTGANPEHANLTCDICGEHDLRGRFPHPDRTGAMVCGQCWVDRERRQRIGETIHHILFRARAYGQAPVETLKLIQRAVRR